jgi:signal transduction histidine kinase
MSYLIDLTVVREVERREGIDLRRTQEAFLALQHDRSLRLLEQARLISELPHLRAATAVYDPERPPEAQPEAVATVRETARRLLMGVDVDLLVLSDLRGTPVAAVGPVAQREEGNFAAVAGMAGRAGLGRHLEGVLALGGGLVHVITVPMEVGGFELGALSVGKILDSHLCGSLETMTGSAVALLDRNRLLAHSDGIPDGAGPVLLASVDRSRREAGPAPTVRLAGGRYRLLAEPLSGPDGVATGTFLVLRSEGNALAFLRGVRQGMMTVLAAATLAALLASFFFASHLTTPIQRLVSFTERVARGDLDTRISLRSGDELSQLGEACNRMTASLAESRRCLEESHARLSERSSELERTNADLLRAKEEAEAANHALQEAHVQLIQAGKMALFGELGAGLAHELKQPLTSIRGYAQLIQIRLPPDDAKTRGHVALIIQAVDHMAETVNGLRNFARKASFQHRDVDVNAVIQRTCLLMKPQISARGIALEVGLADGLPPVWGDPNQLQQVFTNLLANARDALSGRRGRIHVVSGAREGRVEVTVADDGPGIAPEDLPRIFQSFFTTKAEGEGTGLGLAIVHGIVEDHGGTIEVESAPGAGARFRVLLPARKAGEEPATRAA